MSRIMRNAVSCLLIASLLFAPTAIAEAHRKSICDLDRFIARMDHACSMTNRDVIMDRMLDGQVVYQSEELLYDVLTMPVNDYLTLSLYLEKNSPNIVCSLIQIDNKISEPSDLDHFSIPFFLLFYSMELVPDFDKPSFDKLAKILKEIGAADLDINIEEKIYDDLSYKFFADSFMRSYFICVFVADWDMLKAATNIATYLEKLRDEQNGADTAPPPDPYDVAREAEPLPTPIPNPLAILDHNRSYRALYPRNSGDDVKAMQQALIFLGYLTGAADGVYGAETEKAVAAFQKDFVPDESGYATPRTLAYLFDGPRRAMLAFKHDAP